VATAPKPSRAAIQAKPDLAPPFAIALRAVTARAQHARTRRRPPRSDGDGSTIQAYYRATACSCRRSMGYTTAAGRQAVRSCSRGVLRSSPLPFGELAIEHSGIADMAQRKRKSLSERFPEIAAEWDTERNGLSPDQVSASSRQAAWWKCPAGHAYQIPPATRIRTRGCRKCSAGLIGETIRIARLATSVSLAEHSPEITAEWHPIKNVGITPTAISYASARPVWWICSLGHEWRAAPKLRQRGSGCPDCERASRSDRIRTAKLRKSGRSFAEAFPHLVTEWDFAKNNIEPTSISPKSNVKIAWKCKLGHHWFATVCNRTHNGSNCPQCVPQTSRLELALLAECKAVFGEVLWRSKIDRLECDLLIPELQIGIEVDGGFWHRDKLNRDRLKTESFASHGICLVRARDDSLPTIDGNVVLFSNGDDVFEIALRVIAKIATLVDDDRLNAYVAAGQRVNESGYLELVSRLPAPPAAESLSVTHPRIAQEWDHAENAPLTPELFSPGSEQRVVWTCALGHKWSATIKNRTMRRSGCPVCSRASASDRGRQQRARRLGSLAATKPPYLSMWDHSANGELDPSKLAVTSGIKVHWRCAHGHGFTKSPSQMASDSRCPQCRSLAQTHPGLASEWNHELNGALAPSSVTYGSGRRVWWKCAQGHSWQATVAMRVEGTGCPECFERRRALDVDSAMARRTGEPLSEHAPDWLAEWDAERNRESNPTTIAVGSDTLYWWRCDRGHCFQKSPRQRSHGAKCPMCVNLARAEAVRRARLVRSGSLRDNCPEIATEWHPSRNGNLTADSLSANSHQMVWWRCPAGHEWQQTPNARVTLVKRGSSFACPACSGRCTSRLST
jgi:hypothetical protein